MVFAMELMGVMIRRAINAANSRTQARIPAKTLASHLKYRFESSRRWFMEMSTAA